MAKLPDPRDVSSLRALSPPYRTVAAGAALARVYFASGKHPVSWGQFRRFGPSASARFDHHVADAAGRPHAQDRGVLYCAEEGITCIAEVYQASRAIDRTRDDPYLCVFSTMRELRLLDITGAFATQMGASLAIHSGRRDRARAWARALYEAFPCDGLLYLSSMNPGSRAVVLNERALYAIPPAPDFNRPLADPILTDTVDACAARLGYLKL